MNTNGADDLLNQFAELVLVTDDPRRLANRTLDILSSTISARSGAVFSVTDGRVALYASQGIDQSSLDAAESAWTREHDSLQAGRVYYVPDRKSDSRLTEEQRSTAGAMGFLVMPVLEGATLVALLYLDSDKPDFCDETRLGRLARFSRILARAVGEPALEGARPARAPQMQVSFGGVGRGGPRQELLLLLDKHQWNIARVARLTGVTRRTVYMRLERFRIRRKKVPKILKPAPAGAL